MNSLSLWKDEKKNISEDKTKIFTQGLEKRTDPGFSLWWEIPSIIRLAIIRNEKPGRVRSVSREA
ncbi:hypothetical protein [Methanoregula sp.]|uniref:hypothetical protein n=1 Tax=Methanoregula sp. TaxID=2052170 RepID=UPI003C73FD89